MKSVPAVVLTNLGLIALFALSETRLWWAAVLLTWVNLMLYCLRDFSRRVYLFSFLVAYFIFLLGRDTMSELFDYEVSFYEDSVFAHLSLSLTLAMIGVFLGHFMMSRWQKHREAQDRQRFRGWDDLDPRAVGIAQAAGIVFWLSFPFALYYEIDRVMLVLASGYADLYSEAFRTSSATGFMGLVSQATLANSAALAIFLATMPRLKRARPVMLAWFLTILLSLGTGQRSTFITGVLFLFCYAVMRNRVTPEDQWITRKGLVVIALSVPVMVLALAAVETVRGIGVEYGGNPFDVVLSFIYNQGVSSTVITNAFVYSERIPDQNYLLEFTHSGLLARVLGIEVFQGNSVERAMSGGSFAHSLALVVLGEPLYLAGRGTGSSFVAEAFFDLGYSGVVFVALGFGMLLAFTEASRPRRLLFNSIGLLIVQDLFWASRSSATGFLSNLLAPSTLLSIVLIFVLGLAIAGRIRSRQPKAGYSGIRVRPDLHA